MKIDILTIFPNMFNGPFSDSIIKRATDAGKVAINIHDLRQWTDDKHKTVDGKPYGGGAGMVMMIEPVYKALNELDPRNNAVKILITAKGERIMQEKVRELSIKKHLIFICGHYEGVDHRVFDYLVKERISIGNFIMTGGEIPAMAIVDAVVRLVPGVLGNKKSIKEESFSDKASTVKEYPQYTRPSTFKTKDGKVLKVPDILLSGDHEKIRKWRQNNKR